jgi:DNA-binding SARP family transcriptional activator
LALRIYLAGNVAIEDGDALVPERRLPGRQGRTLLAILVHQRDHATTTEQLADLLWDADPPASWPTALRALASKLRTVLPPSMSIEHAVGAYQLRVPPDAWVDVDAARAAVHEAEAALRDGDLEAANGAALVANAIAQRPFLQGDDGGWASRQRAHLRDVRLRALTVRGEAALAAGNLADAASDAELAIGLEPLRETSYVLLMRAQAAAGNRALALATYARLRETLTEEMGVDPSRASEAAYLAIVRSP